MKPGSRALPIGALLLWAALIAGMAACGGGSQPGPTPVNAAGRWQLLLSGTPSLMGAFSVNAILTSQSADSLFANLGNVTFVDEPLSPNGGPVVGNL